MSRDERRTRALHAYHDGELSWFARLRVSRRLARDQGARRELERLSSLADMLREGDAEIPTPDLWQDIRARLAVTPSPAASAPSTRGFWFSPQWLGAGLAAAATVLAVAYGLEWGDAPDPRSVRWLDAGADSALVLQDDAEATIIWVLESSDRADVQVPRLFARRIGSDWS